MFEFINPEVIAVLIPIVTIICVFAFVITAIIIEGRQKEMRHRERVLAMEKGLDIPVEPPKKKPPRYLAIRAWGLVFTLLGLALVIGISGAAGIRHGVWGLVPGMIGVALLVAARLEHAEYQDQSG